MEERTLRPIKFENDRGQFNAWFHGWDAEMKAVIETPDGEVLTTSVGGKNRMIFLDRAQEAKEVMKKQEAKEREEIEKHQQSLKTKKL